MLNSTGTYCGMRPATYFGEPGTRLPGVRDCDVGRLVAGATAGCSSTGHLCACVCSPAPRLVFNRIKPRRCLRTPLAPGSRHMYRTTTTRTSSSISFACASTSTTSPSLTTLANADCSRPLTRKIKDPRRGDCSCGLLASNCKSPYVSLGSLTTMRAGYTHCAGST